MINEIKNNESLTRIGSFNPEEYQSPLLYQVFMHNDAITPMEFVVKALHRYFFMDYRLAFTTMLQAHLHGKALCGLFPKDVAESKVQQIIRHARKLKFPLICSTEVAI